MHLISNVALCFKTIPVNSQLRIPVVCNFPLLTMPYESNY
jgi:hypothetical protein